MRTTSELFSLPTFEERFDYLQCRQRVGDLTFNGRRVLNQAFYKSERWRVARAHVILRDESCDLGVRDRLLLGKVIVHHINPLTPEQVERDDECLYDPENLITCSLKTHNAIHYGDRSALVSDYVPRTPNDTAPWRRDA